MRTFRYPTSLLELLQAVRRRPQMYLGSVSLELLRAYINGYMMCSAANEAQAVVNSWWDEFKTWLNNRHCIGDARGWLAVIRDVHHPGSEQAAFDAFYQELDNFLMFKKDGMNHL